MRRIQTLYVYLVLLAMPPLAAGDPSAAGPDRELTTSPPVDTGRLPAEAALSDSERDYFLSLLGEPRTPEPTTAIDPDLKRELARQIAEAQVKLANARQRQAGASQTQTLDLTAQLLDIARARLLDEQPVDEGRASELIVAAMERAQRRIDTLRTAAARSPEAVQLNARLDHMQQRLDSAKRRYAEADLEREGDPEPSREQVERIYRLAQQRLDEAYATVATLPNADELIEQLDAAQIRLNEARVDPAGNKPPPAGD